MYGSGPAPNSGQAIFTDDVSLQVFMEHLKRLVRTSQQLSDQPTTYPLSGRRSSDELSSFVLYFILFEHPNFS